MSVPTMTRGLRLPVLPNGNADEGICEEIAEPPKGDEDPYDPGPDAEFRCYENTLVEDKD